MAPISETLERELQTLNEEILRLDHEAGIKQEAADKLVGDIRESGVDPLKDKTAFDKVDAAYIESDSLRQEAAEYRARRETLLSRISQDGGHRGPASRKTSSGWRGAVDAFMATEAYQRLKGAGAFSSQSTRIEIPGIEVLGRDEAVRMLQGGGAMFHAVADVDDMVAPDQRLFPPVPIPVRKVSVTELVTISTTDSDQVDYVKETTRTDAAAETAPGTVASEATYVYEAVQAPVRDIVHFTPAHKRNLADNGQIRALLEGRLQSGVERRLETQIVNGGGTGQDLTGILNTADIGSVTRDVSNSERILEVIHRGITAVRLALFDEPDAVGIHPSDYEAAVFEKDSDGAYLLGPASQQTSRTIWGFPAAVTSAFPENTALVGAYKTGAVVWLRSGVQLSASDSHEDFFTKRMVALMAELRAAFAAWQPQAFCEVLSI